MIIIKFLLGKIDSVFVEDLSLELCMPALSYSRGNLLSEYCNIII